MGMLLLALLACPPTETPKYDPNPPEVVDDDLDGFSTEEGDCNDQDPQVHPNSVEACNSIDDNCDGQIDENVLSRFFMDQDDDGFGDPSSPLEACQQPTGAIGNALDCDDADPSIYPSAPEICDGKDNDCDLTIDEDTSLTWYADNDGDGAGDPLNTIESCENPGTYVETGDDCDDGAAAIHPGAPELCNDRDDDCDGEIDDNPTDAPLWYLDGDGDGFAGARLTLQACEAPPDSEAAPSDCDDSSAAINPNASEICNSLDDDCDGAIDEDAIDQQNYYADSDGDGYGDSPSVFTCNAPAGYVADNGDCDEANVAINPGETDLCDGLDNDCSGSIDDGGLCPCDSFNYNGHNYLFCTTEVDWQAAWDACLTLPNYDLLSVDDAAEDDALWNQAATYSPDLYWWTGYTDGLVEGSFGWVSGSSATYTHWNSGEPNNLYGGEDCVLLSYSSHWNDWNCSNQTSYICESN